MDVAVACEGGKEREKEREREEDEKKRKESEERRELEKLLAEDETTTTGTEEVATTTPDAQQLQQLLADELPSEADQLALLLADEMKLSLPEEGDEMKLSLPEEEDPIASSSSLVPSFVPVATSPIPVPVPSQSVDGPRSAEGTPLTTKLMRELGTPPQSPSSGLESPVSALARSSDQLPSTDVVPNELVSAMHGTIKSDLGAHWRRLAKHENWMGKEEPDVKVLRRRTVTRGNLEGTFSARSQASSPPAAPQQPPAAPPQTCLISDAPGYVVERSGNNASCFVELLPSRPLYRQIFHTIPHIIVFCLAPGKPPSVATVELGGDDIVKRVLLLSVVKGYITATLSLEPESARPTSRRLSSPPPPLQLQIVRSVQSTFFPAADCYGLFSPEAALELLMLERENADNVLNHRVGVTYCKPGQTTEAEFFSNQRDACSPAFWDFMSIIAEEISLFNWKGFKGQLSVTDPDAKSYFCKWRSWDVMFHVSALLNAEQQRRLIGNDVALIYFHDSVDEVFSAAVPRSAMTQQFIVVQPVANQKRVFRVACFHRTGLIQSFPPNLPPDPVFDCSVSGELLRDFLLAKLMNGFRIAAQSAPLNKLFQRPRQVKLMSLCDRFLPEATHVAKAPKKK